MEFVFYTPLHLNSLWRPVLDVTRTVNHLLSMRMKTIIRMMMVVRMRMRLMKVMRETEEG